MRSANRVLIVAAMVALVIVAGVSFVLGVLVGGTEYSADWSLIRWQRVEVGMSRAEVERILGSPIHYSEWRQSGRTGIHAFYTTNRDDAELGGWISVVTYDDNGDCVRLSRRIYWD